MKKSGSSGERPQFLSGWKDIANFLGKGVRTIQRYEREQGLPVRRPAGKDRGSVVAVVAELEGWVKASPIREVFQLRNTTLQSPSAALAIRSGVSELITLREQMAQLRSELHESVARLHKSVLLLQGEMDRERSKPLSAAHMQETQGMIDATDLLAAPIGYPKVS
jgi:hypothetical protein